MRVLGVSAFYHDSAAALVLDGRVAAAAQEERFTRRKHDARFPARAVRFCLEHARLSPDDVDYVVFYEKPFLKFERLLETYLAFAPRGYRSFAMALPLWIREKLFQKDLLTRELSALGFSNPAGRLLFTEHHQSHAASAFYPSPFDEAVVLTMDGVGEWATTSVSVGRGRTLQTIREIHFPHSLGLLYSAFTHYTGFKVNSGEYKVMGLAPYGTPRFASTIFDTLIDVKPDGSFRLNIDYFDYCTGLRMINARFERLWIQPAAGDAGGAVGAALAAYHLHAVRDRVAPAGVDGMSGSYLGPAFGQVEIERRLEAAGAAFCKAHDDEEVIEETASALEGGLAVGWFQGRMEFGPRALGARSILADPRRAYTQKVLNLKVKYRESSRPFAPSVLREDVADWFDLNEDSPYMLLVADVRGDRQRPMTDSERQLFGIDKLNVVRSDIPAVTHVDYSARIQTVHRETSPLYHRLLERFKAKTGCPVLVNTSFNVRGEPIVCTPEDAFRCFMGTALDMLVIGRCILRKQQQNPAMAHEYASTLALD